MNAEPRVERDELIILGELVPLAGQNVIELGCGAARLARDLLARYPSAQLTGLPSGCASSPRAPRPFPCRMRSLTWR